MSLNKFKSWWIIYRFYWSNKNKKATINPINKKDKKCFQYSVTLALNHEEIKKDRQRITTIKPFINKYNYKGINYPSKKDVWEKNWEK